MSAAVVYKGNASVLSGTFIDVHDPLPGKTEWGMDTLTRTVKGIQPHAAAYDGTLVQGDSYSDTATGNDWFLQSWECDNNPVFPGFTLNHKGLFNGIPDPKASGGTIEQCITLCAHDVGTYTNATREIKYATRQTTTLYITDERPTTASYGIDVDADIFILSSVIRAEDSAGNSYVFSGADAPTELVTALTPAIVVQSFMECSPVVGSPYFECRDQAVKLYMGSS